MLSTNKGNAQMNKYVPVTNLSAVPTSGNEADHAGLTSQPAFLTLIEAVKNRRDEFNTLRHIPRDVVSLMKSAGIFRACSPSYFGGSAMAPHHFLKMVEKLGEYDGSAAWVAAFGSSNTYIAALPLETQAAIYATGPDQVYAGGLYPVQKAERVEGGWRVTGRWKFASGCMGADWIGVGISGQFGDTANAPPVVKMAVCPAAEVEIIDTWNVVGMRATGSHDTQVVDKFYADEWTCDRGSRGIFDEPLYRYPPIALQAAVHAAVNLGLARAALEIAVEMSGGAKIMPGSPALANRGYFKSGLAEGEAKLRAARAFFYETAESAWAELQDNAEVSLNLANLLRLSASHAARVSCDVISHCFRIVGMAAVQDSHRMQHILRDAIVVTQHASLNDATLENAGAVLAGISPPAGYP